MDLLYVYGNCSPTKYKSLMEMTDQMIMQQSQKYNQLMLEGIAQNNCDVLALSSLPVNRRLTKKVFFKKEEDFFRNIKYKYLSFVNIPLLRNICIFFNSFFFCLKCKNIKIVCDVLNISITAGAILAAQFNHSKILGIITDVPGMMAYESKFIHGINKKILNRFDAYLFLTEQMNTLINLKNRPYIIIEGQADIEMKRLDNKLCDKYEKNVCMYTGSINKAYGIDTLVSAFINADEENSELHIYGDGDYKEELLNLMGKSERIKYFGVKSNEFIIKEQLKATLLINPRPTNNEYTKYSFPSKNIEYMASGTPILTTRLPGMPVEYYDYIFLIEKETTEGIAASLRDVLSKPREERHQKGLMAKEFILSHKNNITQAQKLIRLLEKV